MRQRSDSSRDLTRTRRRSRSTRRSSRFKSRSIRVGRFPSLAAPVTRRSGAGSRHGGLWSGASRLAPTGSRQTETMEIFLASSRWEIVWRSLRWLVSSKRVLNAPDARAFYCDEEIATADGETPVFKPDWSPRLQAAKPYVGRLMLTRLAHMRRRAPSRPTPIEERGFVESILRDLGREEVRHIRRVLTRTEMRRGAERELAPPSRAGLSRRPDTSVTIVLPTRDRAEFLRRAISGVLQKTKFSPLDLIVVDNGTVDPEALKTLESATGDPRVTLLDAPGPFNFSALCNLGAARARGEVVIFLNNDVEIIDPDWVSELVEYALDPTVGAVGCKLLYPNRRIQHAGIVLGLGDGVGHFDSGCHDGEPGWLGRNHVVHEASAVTGACLAVERAKFLAVGGFDAVHLPVEFNDVDLCLRLEERGFQTVWTPFARLIHFESTSRGKATFRRLDVHAAERGYFRKRWGDRLRDDPYFHPGLSLFSLSFALA